MSRSAVASGERRCIFLFNQTERMGGLDRMTASKHQQGSPTGNPDADQLLRENGNALVIGILLDQQQVRAEMAFEGPQAGTCSFWRMSSTRWS